VGLTGDPKGEKPENRLARRCRVLSIFPGDWGGAISRLVASMVGVEFVDVLLVREERKLMIQVRVCVCFDQL
jgi:hypothetical protein